MKTRKKRDELKAKLDDAENREHSSDADRIRLGFKCDELRKRLEAAERCIEDIEPLIGEYTIGDCYPHGPAGEKILNIIRAYRAQKEAK